MPSATLRRSFMRITLSAGLWLTLGATCSGGNSGELECKGGEFYLAGEKFKDCSQCSQPASCSFNTNSTKSYDSNGNPSGGSGTTTASCAGQRATVTFKLSSAGQHTDLACGSSGTTSETCKVTNVSFGQYVPVPVNGTAKIAATSTTSCGQAIDDGTEMEFTLNDKTNQTGTVLAATKSRLQSGVTEASLKGGPRPGYVYLSAFVTWRQSVESDSLWVAVYEDPCFPAEASLILNGATPSTGTELQRYIVSTTPAVRSQCPAGVPDGTPVRLEVVDNNGGGPDTSGASVEPTEAVTKGGKAEFSVRAGTAPAKVRVRAVVGIGLRTDEYTLVLKLPSDAGVDAAQDARRDVAPDVRADAGAMDGASSRLDAPLSVDAFPSALD